MAISRIESNSIAPSQTLTTPIVATTMGVGGATPAGSGSGITFPAAQSGSTDANTLDDYEEGTFSAVLTDSSGNSATMTTNTFNYTKVGNLVFVTGTLVWSSTSSLAAGSRLRLSGLPFVSAGNPSGGQYRSAFNFGSSNNAFLVTRSQIALGLDAGVSFVWFTLVSGNNQDNAMNKDSINTSGTIYGITGTYQTT